MISEKEAVIDFAKTLEMSYGDVYFIFTDASMFGHTHTAKKRGELSYEHTDGWAVRNDGLTYSIAKIHSDDFERGVTPNFQTYY